MTETSVEISVIPSIQEVAAEDWDACSNPHGTAPAMDPFTTHRFLLALETSGSVGTGTGWHPQHLVARANNEVIAVAPLYAKGHSQGEYIFDHNWAHAFERAGGRYYPKLQLTVPFTPATGRRFLTRTNWETMGQAALVQGAVQLADTNDISSLHITFCTEDEAAAGAEMGLLRRTSQQFHWSNNGYETPDDFLASLSARKRKNIRKERETAQSFGGIIRQYTGNDLKPEHWDAFWRFYQDTGARKWGTPYLTRRFFDIAQETLRDDILLILAERDAVPIAGALNFIGQHALYGRYWGCVEDHPCLHFELCYYQAIDHAIKRGLSTVEAGAQGSHKLARGYLPVTTHSLHWIADPGFRAAIERYVKEEHEVVDQEVRELTDYGPFKKGT